MIKKNIINLNSKVTEIAKACGRERKKIRLVAVSKRFPLTAIHEAQEAGQVLFGENYIQEAKRKYDSLDQKAQIHFIGHLQSNKAKIAANIFSMIETVDSLKLATALNKQLKKLNKKLDILLQVNIGNDAKKSGVAPEKALELAADISELPMLRTRGLMTMPPVTQNPEDARPHFKNLRLLADTLAKRNLFFDNTIELSMGMSHDYHIAIEEGATLIRIGTAIFGMRPPKT